MYRVGKMGNVYRIKSKGKSRRKTFKTKTAAMRMAKKRKKR